MDLRAGLDRCEKSHLHRESIPKQDIINSNIHSKHHVRGVVTVLGRPGRGASQLEKSPRLNWATQFLTVAYDSACSPKVFVRMA